MGYTITFHFANPKITKAIFEAIAPTNETGENPPLGFENVEPFNKIKFNLGKGPYSPNLKSDNSIISIHLEETGKFRPLSDGCVAEDAEATINHHEYRACSLVSFINKTLQIKNPIKTCNY